MPEEPIPREDVIYHHAIRVLHAGFLVAAVLLVAGVAWSLVERRPLDERVISFADLPSAISDGDPSAVIDLGILALMITPVVLVIVIARDFYELGERRYTIASLLVLAVLTTSIVISLFR